MTQRERRLLAILAITVVASIPVAVYAYTGATPVGPGITLTCQTSQPGPVNTAREWVRCSDGATIATSKSNVDNILSTIPAGGQYVLASPSPSPGQHLQYSGTGYIWTPVAAGTATVAIGSPIASGHNNTLIYENGSSLLSEDNGNLTYDDVAKTLQCNVYTSPNTGNTAFFFASGDTVNLEGQYAYGATPPGGASGGAISSGAWASVDNAAASSGTPLQVPPDQTFSGRCWDGSASKQCGAGWYTTATGTGTTAYAPQECVRLSRNGNWSSDAMCIGYDGTTITATVAGSAVCTQATGCGGGGGGSLQASYNLGNTIVISSPSPSPQAFRIDAHTTPSLTNQDQPFIDFYDSTVGSDTYTAPGPPRHLFQVFGGQGHENAPYQKGGGIACDTDNYYDDLCIFYPGPPTGAYIPGDLELMLGDAQTAGVGAQFIIRSQRSLNSTGGPVTIVGGPGYCGDPVTGIGTSCSGNVVLGAAGTEFYPNNAPVAPYYDLSGPGSGGEMTMVSNPVTGHGFLFVVPSPVPSPDPTVLQVSSLSIGDSGIGAGMIYREKAAVTGSNTGGVVLQALYSAINVYERVNLVYPTAAFTAPWINVSGGVGYSNGYSDYGNGTAAVAYWKDPNGVVHLHGCAAGGTAATAVFTLPVNYRPDNLAIFAGVIDSEAVVGAAIGFIKISSAGVVTPSQGGNTNICFDGITFPGEN